MAAVVVLVLLLEWCVRWWWWCCRGSVGGTVCVVAGLEMCQSMMAWARRDMQRVSGGRTGWDRAGSGHPAVRYSSKFLASLTITEGQGKRGRQDEENAWAWMKH